MLLAKVELFEHTLDTLVKLSALYNLMLITKGDLFEQGSKVQRSGLAQHFCCIEIVGEKTSTSYRAILERHDLSAERFLMVGNSLRSDILPVLEIGGRAVYIPYEHTWVHEQVTGSVLGGDGYFELEHLGQLPSLMEKLGQE
jgi:putative hydrolase of the HAD superfamily